MEKDILIGVLTKTLNKSEQEITDLLYQNDGDELVIKDGALDEILSLDSARVEKIKKHAPIDRERLSNEYKRGQKEALEGLESSLIEKYSVNSDKKGIELVEEVILSKSKASKMSDDEVKKHPLYLELEKSRIPKDDYEKVMKEYNDYKSGIELDKKYSFVENKAGGLLDELKPIVSDNPKVAQTRRNDFLRKFREYDYQIEGDNTIILNKDGSRLEDGHGNPLPFDNFVKEIAMSNYDFPKQDDKGNSGSDPDKKQFNNIVIPKNDDEYVAAIRNAKTVDEKVAIKAAYEAKK